jgi:hypothetical protein
MPPRHHAAPDVFLNSATPMLGLERATAEDVMNNNAQKAIKRGNTANFLIFFSFLIKKQLFNISHRYHTYLPKVKENSRKGSIKSKETGKKKGARKGRLFVDDYTMRELFFMCCPHLSCQ